MTNPPPALTPASVDLLTLALDASTYRGTVAVLRGDQVIAEGEAVMRGETEERLMPAVAGALRAAAIEVSALDRVVCGSGPGSFTSLRIAASIAKGIASGRGIPLHAASSLLLIAAGTPTPLAAGRYLVLLDAMRGERFALDVEVEATGRIILAAPFVRIAASESEGLVEQRGEGWRVLDGSMVDGGESPYAPHARGVALLIRHGMLGPAVSLERWEPEYGRLAEAQVKWEASHGRALPSSGT